MFLFAGSKAGGRSDRRTIHREYDILDKRKPVTALRAGEDKAMLLGLSMVLFSVMMYFVLGITILRSYTDRCGTECWRRSRYPCLQVYVSLNSSGKVVRLLHNEEVQESNPECFYIPKCQKDYAALHAMIQNISERLKSQHTVQCFVDPTDRMDSAILMQIYSLVTVLHSLFWPTFTLIGGTIIIAMVKLTQSLSIMCERTSRIKR
ncbi:hypothetical protein JOQ06_005917 [Pogonophryne albipinna]|uniref:Uncharacterized protein n=1 Tax=Pogonophryne albipinna TaxID=1090488 RepID=A0AAD6BJS1_9TELE|nr:hypothetical protein JOQ06_005917 [Pogonophryne albipinna]